MIQITEQEYADLLAKLRAAEAMATRALSLASAAQNVVDVYKFPFVWKRKDAMRRLVNELEGR